MFLRPAGDRAAFVSSPSVSYHNPPKENEYAALRHGDLIRCQSFVVASVYVVVEVNEGTSKYCISVVDDNALVVIPLSVSALIENPVEFYGNVSAKTFEGTIDEIHGVREVYMHAANHASSLRVAAGNRDVHESRVVRWDSFDGYRIRSPLSEDIINDTENVYLVELCAKTSAEYLTAATSLEIDPISDDQRKENNRVHSVAAQDYFSTLVPGSTIDVQEVPSELWMRMFTFTEKFADVEFDNAKIVAIYTTMAETGTRIKYTLNSWMQKGPFGGVRVWSTKEPQVSPRGTCVRMIDLAHLSPPFPLEVW